MYNNCIHAYATRVFLLSRNNNQTKLLHSHSTHDCTEGFPVGFVKAYAPIRSERKGCNNPCPISLPILAPWQQYTLELHHAPQMYYLNPINIPFPRLRSSRGASPTKDTKDHADTAPSHARFVRTVLELDRPLL